DSEVQWATTPASFDSVIQSEESLQVDVVAPVQAFKPEIPKDNRGIQAVILPTKFDVETQSGVISQIGTTQTAEQPKPAPQTEDQTVIHAQTITTATINKKLQVALLPQSTDAHIQAEMAPSRYDVEAQSGIISHVGSTQTAAEYKPKVQMTDSEVQWATTPAAFDSVIQSEESLQVDVVAPVQAFKSKIPKYDRDVQTTTVLDSTVMCEIENSIEGIVPVEAVPKTTHNVATQAVVQPELYDVETQSGVISRHSDVQTTTVAEDMQLSHKIASVVNTLNKKLQVDLSPLQNDIGTQLTDSQTTTVSFRVRGDQKDFSVQTLVTPDCFDVEVEAGRITRSANVQTERAGLLDDMFVMHRLEQSGSKMALKTDVQDAQIQAQLQTDQISHRLPYVVKELQLTYEPQLSDAFVQVNEPITTSLCVKCQRASEQVTTKNKKFQVYSSGSDMSIQTEPDISVNETQPVHAVRTNIVDSVVTTVSYEEPSSLRNKKLQVITSGHCVNSEVQADVQPVRIRMVSSLVDAVHQFQTTTQEDSVPLQSHAQMTSTATRLPIVISDSQDYAQSSRNKKLQVTLITSDEHKPVMVNKKLQNQAKQEEFACQVGVETSTAGPCKAVDARIVPLIKVDAECQAKVTQYGKKMQFSPTGQDKSCQTDQSGTKVPETKSIIPQQHSKKTLIDKQVLTDTLSLHEASTEMTNASWIQPIEIDMVASIQQKAPTTIRTRNLKDLCVQTETAYTDRATETDTETTVRTETTFYTTDRKTRNVKDSAGDAIKPTYVTQIIQAEAPVTSIAVTKVTQQQSAPVATGKSTRDFECEVSLITPTSTFQKSSYVMTHIQMEIPTQDDSVQTEQTISDAPATLPVVQKRHVKIQKGSSWLESRMTNAETQVERSSPETVMGGRRFDVMDATESYIHGRHVASGSGRIASITSPTGSMRERKHRPQLISWGVQCAPVTLAGVTQTIESETNGRGVGIRLSTTIPSVTVGHSVSVQTESESLDDDYYIKRVVTTIARRGSASTYRRQAPVVRQVNSRGQANLLTSSLPSNLDEEFFDNEDELLNPITTRKITTTQTDGSRRVVREELIMEETRDRGRSLDSRLACAYHSEHELHEAENSGMREELECYSDAENCFRNLLRQWGSSYLMSRLSRQRTSSMSVDRDLGAPILRTSRLVGARTQYTSTGSLMAQPTGQHQRTTETQTTGLTTPHTRPPHKNKRIQRGESYIAWTGSQEFVSPSVEGQTASGRQRSAPPTGMTTTVTETIHEHSTYGIQAMSEEYTCLKCGTNAQFPIMSTLSTQSHSLPITQLRNTPSQTKSLGYYTLENDALTLPVYLTDEEVFRVNPEQELKDDRQFSVVTWCPGDDRESEKSDESETTADVPHDEVWVDSPGKLLELQVTGVTVPGTNTVISAAEAFYRGLLRVVYWDYTKVGPRQSSTELGVAIPLIDAVLNHSVKLATDTAQIRTQKTASRGEQTIPSLDAHVVWTTPEMNRSRYVIHAVKPEVEHSDIGTGKTYNLAGAIRAGYVDRESGQVIVRLPSDGRKTSGSQQTMEDESAGITQPEYLTVKEAIRRGILVAELIEPASPYHTTEEQMTGLSMFSPSHIQQDMDI
ncbi:hypothetical protein D915_008953, partial [Fasciola hepatica]